MEEIDYAGTGLDISQAMIDQAKRYPRNATRPSHIIWAGDRVQTFDWWDVPNLGVVRIELLGDGVEQPGGRPRPLKRRAPVHGHQGRVHRPAAEPVQRTDRRHGLPTRECAAVGI